MNLLQYADDTCIIASSPAAAQSLLDSTSEWLQWADMKAKVPEYHSLHIKSSSGILTNPHLTCSNETIRYVANCSINFLGLPIQFPKDCNRTKSQLKSLLQSMFKVVDETPLTRKQKVKIYSLEICPRLNWLLTINEFLLSWIKRQLDATSTSYLKRWTGLTKSANPNMFYIPRSEGGLQLPSISTLYKKLQASKHSQLVTSKDTTVRHLAEKNLETEIKSIRKIFKPSMEVQQTMVDDPSWSRKALLKAVKNRITYSDANRCKSELLALPVQGLLFTTITTILATHPTKIWTDAIRSLPNECYKFVLNAAHALFPITSTSISGRRSQIHRAHCVQ